MSLLRAMLPDSRRLWLLGKLARCTTRDGKNIVLEAIVLSYKHRLLTGPQLIRLAYWGTPGTTED